MNFAAELELSHNTMPLARTHRLRAAVAALVAAHVAAFGGFQLPKIDNPFDSRPGVTVGKLQVALANEDMRATKVVAQAAARFESDRSRRALPDFVNDVATQLCRRRGDWLYASCAGERFDGGAVDRDDHEVAYNRLVNAEAAKFEVERMPSQGELESTAAGVRGMCVVSLVVALEGDLLDAFTDAARSEASLSDALADVAAACLVRGGDALYNAEVLWTPSSADEALFKDDALLDFPELLQL